MAGFVTAASSGLLLTGAGTQPGPCGQSTVRDTPDVFAGIPNLAFKYYDVQGTAWKAITASLNAIGPRHGDGTIAHGRTAYRIEPTWTEQRRGSSCKVTNVQVQFSAVVLLPRLAEKSLVSGQVLEEWGRFVALLQRHEAGHAHIAFENVDHVRAAVAGSACDQVQANAQAVLTRIEGLQQDYDRRTQNGRAQGDILR